MSSTTSVSSQPSAISLQQLQLQTNLADSVFGPPPAYGTQTQAVMLTTPASVTPIQVEMVAADQNYDQEVAFHMISLKKEAEAVQDYFAKSPQLVAEKVISGKMKDWGDSIESYNRRLV